MKTLARESTESASSAVYVLVACLASLVFIGISFAPQISVPKYRYAWLSLVPVVWLAYALRRSLAVRPTHFAMFAVALLLHDLGAFGWYSRRIVGLQFDWCLHFYFGLVGGLVVARALQVRLGLQGTARALLVVFVVGGIAALHEVVEAASTMFLGDNGMLYIGADNPFDSQEDLLAGVLGAVTAMAYVRIRGDSRRTSRP